MHGSGFQGGDHVERAPHHRLRFWTKLIYGSGEWSIASFGTLRQIFYAIFLVDVVGLEPRLASFAALAGVIWDAINDPIVGTLSDRMKSRWGRRRPFLLFFTIPFALGFIALWYAPPFESQIALMLYCMFAYMLSDTLQTLVVVPYYSLMPEVAPGYDQRTSVTGYRMVFNLLASLATAVLGPMIVKSTLSAGFTQQQGYLITAALFGGLATIPLFLIFATVRERFAGSGRERSRSAVSPIGAHGVEQHSVSLCDLALHAQLDHVRSGGADAAVLFDVLDRAGQSHREGQHFGRAVHAGVGGAGPAADHGDCGRAVLDVAGAQARQAPRLHHRHEFLGGGAAADFFDSTAAGRSDFVAGCAGGPQRLDRARAARRDLPRRDRMG